MEGGKFSLREARHYLENREIGEKVQWHDNVWDSIYWPKIKTLLCLMMHRKILTSENLLSKGFIGPSCCFLCGMEDETMNHLLNSCKLVASVWDWMEEIFRQTDHSRESIQDTVSRWRVKYARHEIVNLIWCLGTGFLVWMVWKERNKRIL